MTYIIYHFLFSRGCYVTKTSDSPLLSIKQYLPSMMSFDKPAALNTIQREERDHVVVSLVSFISFICYGYFACSIGAGLPELSQHLAIDEANLAMIFTARGIGFIAGTFLFSLAIEFHHRLPSKEFIVAMAVLGSSIGAMVLSIPAMNTLTVVLGVVFLQALLFSGIDVMCNTLLPALWGMDVQPWLHALHACWSVGGIIGPSVLGQLGYFKSNAVLSVCCTTPLLLVMLKPRLLQDDDCILWELYACICGTGAAGAGTAADAGTDAAGSNGHKGGCASHATQLGVETACHSSPSNGSPISPVSPDRSSLSSPGIGGGAGGLSVDIIIDHSDLEPMLQSSPPSYSPSPLPPSRPLSIAIRAAFYAFYFFYVGLESGYSGWISVYVGKILPSTDAASGAYLVTVFFFAMSIGRLLSVPLALHFSPHYLMRMQLGFTLLGVLMVYFVGMGQFGYAGCFAATAMLGYGISSIFPIGMTLASEYQLTMLVTTKSYLIIGNYAMSLYSCCTDLC